jgi:histone deacetylase complex regulatory component SIN3
MSGIVGISNDPPSSSFDSQLLQRDHILHEPFETHTNVHQNTVVVTASRLFQVSNQLHQSEIGNGITLKYALQYIHIVKRRFRLEPQNFQEFLNVLREYQTMKTLKSSEQQRIVILWKKLADLFKHHPDLLKKFTHFLSKSLKRKLRNKLLVLNRDHIQFFNTRVAYE